MGFVGFLPTKPIPLYMVTKIHVGFRRSARSFYTKLTKHKFCNNVLLFTKLTKHKFLYKGFVVHKTYKA